MWFYLIQKGTCINVYKMCEVDFFIGLTVLPLNTDLGNLKNDISEGSMTANLKSLLVEAVNFCVITWEIGCTSQEGTEGNRFHQSGRERTVDS